MIENLQNEAKDVKLRANIRWNLDDEKCPKTFFKVLES